MASAKKRVQYFKKGSESVETGLVSIGLLIIGAVLVIIFAMLSSSIYNLLVKKEAQGTAESFNLLVAKMEALDLGTITESQHAYYIQNDYQLFGFNNNPAEIRYGSSNTVVGKQTKMCGPGEACLCVCDDSQCKGKVTDCNRKTGGAAVTFNSIKYFVVTDATNKLNQGNKITMLPNGFSGNYLAIFGQWGGFGNCGFGIGVSCWPQGRIIYLVKKGAVVELSFEKPAGFGTVKSKGSIAGGATG